MFGLFKSNKKTHNKRNRQEDLYKNYEPMEQIRRNLLNSKETGYTPEEMNAAEKILTMKKTQPEYSKYGDAGKHMAVSRYNTKLGEEPSLDLKRNRRRNRRKTPTNRRKRNTSFDRLIKKQGNYHDYRIYGQDKSDLRPRDDKGQLIIPPSPEPTFEMVRNNFEQRNYIRGGKTIKRRRKGRRKTKRKGRRKTKKKRKMRKRKTRRKR